MESYTKQDDPWIETIDGQEVQYYRADGSLICTECDKSYYRHPLEKSVVDYLSRDINGNPLPFLRRICNGDLVKL